jgi:peptide/nickel transport system ATP-binding protein
MGDQIAEIVRVHRPSSATTSRIAAMLVKVGVAAPEQRLQQYPHQLSGGLRQRMMIATALLCEPELIIADEPTTALDVTIQAQILRLLADVRRESRVGLLLITHDLGVVAGLADRIVVMYAGEVVEAGPADALLGSPRHPYTEGLLRAIPVPGERGRREPLPFIPGMVPHPSQSPTTCGFLARCSYAHDDCSRGAMPLRGLGDGHAVRCCLDDRKREQPIVWKSNAGATA